MEALEYHVVAPKKIMEVRVDLPDPPAGSYLVKVTHAQVCDADAKYYYGLRPRLYCLLGFRYLYGVRKRKDMLRKYPMLLLHEATGLIEKAGPGASLKLGARVVLIPSKKCSDPACSFCREGNENRCKASKFMSSNAPGFARTRLIQPSDCIAVIPDEVPDSIAVHAEMSTVAYGSLIEAGLGSDDTVAVFGDGYLGYMLSALASEIFHVPKERLFVFGRHDDKLGRFSAFASTINLKRQGLPEELLGKVTKVFECVGKRSAEGIMDSSISMLRPGGTMMLLGVSEEKVPLNTRDVLSKAITIKGLSRSPARFYPVVLEAMRSERLRQLYSRLGEETLIIKSANDIRKAFEAYMLERKKVLMMWSE